MLDIFIKKAIGIDIADRSIEAAEVKKLGGKIMVKSLGRQELADGIVRNGMIIKQEELAVALNKTLAEAQPHPISGRKIIFGFPESQTYTHIFSHQYPGEEIDAEEIDKIVLQEAWANIPITRSEMLVEYEIVKKEQGRIDVLIVAAPRRVVVEWQKFFGQLGLEIAAFDVEPIANFRNLEARHKKSVMVVDIGSATTNIYIFHRNKLVYEHTVNIAGDNLTAEIVAALKIKPAEAENEKETVGLSDPEAPFFAALIKILERILEEIRNSLRDYSGKYRKKVDDIIFIGGSSQLKGLLEYFSANLEVPVALGVPRVYQGKEMEYLGAIGMALRGLYKKYDKEDPFIPFAGASRKEQQDETLAAVGFSEEGSDSQSFSEPAAESQQQLRTKKKILVVILLVGVLCLGLAYSYRSREKQKRAEEIKAAISKIANLPAEQATTTGVATTTSNVSTSTVVTENATTTNIIKAVIQKTEVGYLNVRENAGKEFKILAKVKPGDAYELLAKQGEWVKIKVSASLAGWVSSKYIIEQKFNE